MPAAHFNRLLPIERPGGLARRGAIGGRRCLLLIARAFLLHIVGKILVVLLRHLRLALEEICSGRAATSGSSPSDSYVQLQIGKMRLASRTFVRRPSAMAQLLFPRCPVISRQRRLAIKVDIAGCGPGRARTAQCGGIGIHTGGLPENRIRFNTTASATSNGLR